ncbi:MAG TPA: CinA family protein [Chloroflexota bacterium]|jgi:PncC family amidohydrolase
MNEELLALAARVGERLREGGQTVAVAESSAGGLAAAALLAQPGASAYFRGGAVVYTGDAKSLLLGLSREAISQPRAATPEHALILARGIRERLGATWGIGETGAAGPTGNRYGDPPGHSCLGVSGPVELSEVVRTGSEDRSANMVAFAIAGLRVLEAALERAGR